MKATEDSQRAAQGLIKLVEVFTVAQFGKQAELNEIERGLIEDPLAEVIETYGGLADRYSALINPIMVAAGAVLYGIRLSRIAGSPSDDQSPPAEPPPAEPPPPPAQSIRDLQNGRPFVAPAMPLNINQRIVT